MPICGHALENKDIPNLANPKLDRRIPCQSSEFNQSKIGFVALPSGLHPAAGAEKMRFEILPLPSGRKSRGKFGKALDFVPHILYIICRVQKRGCNMDNPTAKSRCVPQNPKDKFFKMRTDEKMLALLDENSRMTGNTKSDEVRIAIEERNKRLKRK